MTDPMTQGDAALPSTAPTVDLPQTRPPSASDVDENPIRYDANVQLILRRLADADRTDKKPRWWWQAR